jgi:hypothetical protein
MSDAAAGGTEAMGAAAMRPNCLLCGDDGIDAKEIAAPDDGVIACIRCGRYRLTGDVRALLVNERAETRTQVADGEADPAHPSGPALTRGHNGDATNDFPIHELHRVAAYTRGETPACPAPVAVPIETPPGPTSY